MPVVNTRVKEDGSVAVATSCARQDLLQTPCVGRSRKARVCETARHASECSRCQR